MMILNGVLCVAQVFHYMYVYTAWASTNVSCPLLQELHETIEGSLICCFPRYCEPGTFVKLCSSISDPWPKCEECIPDTFNPARRRSTDHYYRCHNKRSCLRQDGFGIIDDGSTVRDRVCTCLVNDDFYDYDYQSGSPNSPIICVKKICDSGTKLLLNGSCLPINSREANKSDKVNIGAILGSITGTTVCGLAVLLTWIMYKKFRGTQTASGAEVVHTETASDVETNL